jgi:hypothetical protein
MHAAVFSEQPFEIPLIVNVFLETDKGHGVPLETGRVLVTAEIAGPLAGQSVPLLARDLAAPAGGASGRIYKFYHVCVFHSLSPKFSSR